MLHPLSAACLLGEPSTQAQWEQCGCECLPSLGAKLVLPCWDFTCGSCAAQGEMLAALDGTWNIQGYGVIDSVLTCRLP